MLEQNIPVEKHIIKTNDGHFIEAWFAHNQNPEARTKVYLHGNGSDISSFATDAAKDYNNGHNVCLFSYRGYSGNPGYPSEAGLVDDTNSVIDFLVEQRGINTGNIDFEAHSLGCAVVLNTLAKRLGTSSQEQFGDLILMAPFKNIRAMIIAQFKFVPNFLINWLTNGWNNYEALPKLKGHIAKMTLIHSRDDELIPVQHSRDLHQLALQHSINSELIEVSGKGHNDITRDSR